MPRFHCPECGAEAVIAPRYGDDVIAAYCLRHRGGADAHSRPVQLIRVPEAVIAVEALEVVLA